MGNGPDFKTPVVSDVQSEVLANHEKEFSNTSLLLGVLG
jgi:hypothetical protein